MNYSKVMQRVFSNSAKDKSFQKSFSDALDVAEKEGSAKITGEEEGERTDLTIDKEDDGSFTITDHSNGDEVTKAVVNDDNVQLEKVESEPVPVEPAPTEPKPEEPTEPEKPVEDVEEVTLKEKSPEEYEVITKEGTFSVKGDLKKAIKFAKTFSETGKITMDLTDVTCNMNPEKRVDANIGVVDPNKAGTPEARSFSEEVADLTEKAKEAAKENPEGSVIEKDGRKVLVQHKEGKFSFFKMDLVNRVFSEIEEQDIVGTLEGTNVEPEKNNPADLGVDDPEKAGNPENRSFDEMDPGKVSAIHRALEQFEKANKPYTAEDVAKKVGCSVADVNKAKRTFSDSGSEEDPKDNPDEKPEGTKTLDEQVEELSKVAEEVDNEPTEENVKTLEDGIAEVKEKVECDKSYSSIKKEITYGKLKVYSDVVAQAKQKVFSNDNFEVTEEQNRSFSALFATEAKTFATKEEVDAATKHFSESGTADNPCMTVEF